VVIVAATGHRPKDITEDHGVVLLKARVKMEYRKADRLICGMAAGFDLLAAKAAMQLNIPVTAAIPWDGHRDSIDKDWRERWDKVFEYADVKHYVNDKVPEARWEYAKFLHNRNHWMVDNATHIMAYWTGKESGGTYECIKYAKSKGKLIANIYHDPPF
jgi:uncharacterized phage-like protein YoqJ